MTAAVPVDGAAIPPRNTQGLRPLNGPEPSITGPTMATKKTAPAKPAAEKPARKPAARKAAAPKPAAPKAASKPAALRPATKAAAAKKPVAKPTIPARPAPSLPSRALGAFSIGAAVVAVGAAIVETVRRLRGRSGEGHEAPDLALDHERGTGDRAPEAFRPDPTAPVPASEREALRPATMPLGSGRELDSVH